MYRTLIGLCLVFACISPSEMRAQQQDEIVSIRKSQLTQDQIAQMEQQRTADKIETYGKWVGLGKEVGEAVNGSLSALSTQADSFAKTGVGKFTMALVAYKVIGEDALDVLVTIPLMIVMTCIFIWSYRKSCVTRSILIEDTKEGGKRYKVINAPFAPGIEGDPDLDVRRLTHVGIYLVVMFILLLIAVANG